MKRFLLSFAEVMFLQLIFDNLSVCFFATGIFYRLFQTSEAKNFEDQVYFDLSFLP